MDIILDCVQKKTGLAENEDEKYSTQDESLALTPPPLMMDPAVGRVDTTFINGSCSIKLKKKERKKDDAALKEYTEFVQHINKV